jgi:TfoX/Sxy family transcriptional regulator of competence genes
LGVIVAPDEELVNRVRTRLSTHDDVTEKDMFGTLAFLLKGHMVVAVRGSDLIVRVHPGATQRALEQPGAQPFDLTGHPLRGWILAAGESLDAETLDRWVGEAEATVAALDSN